MASSPKSTRNSSYVVWAVAIVVVLLALFALRSLTEQRVTVGTAKVTLQDLSKTSQTNGKVEPVDDFKLTAQAAGQVHEVYVKLGQHVVAGQMLLKMDDRYAVSTVAHANSELKASEQAATVVQQGGTPEERNSMAAELSQAELQRQQDAATLNSLKQLQQHGAASASEVAAAQHRLEIDENHIQSVQQRMTNRYGPADRAKVQAEVADARAAIAAAEGTLAHADIRSPIPGEVYYLPVSRFDMVSVGDDLVSVADLNKLRVTAYFDEPEVGNLANGQPVTIKWDARPDKLWHGHVSQIPTTIITYGTRNVGECFVTVDDADGTLQPNSNVLITVTTAEHKNVLAVPRDSLHFEGSQPYVFRVVDNKLVQTPVKIAGGIVNYNWAEITSGLSEGDVVARNATNNSELKDGLKVKTAK
ncbi:MAG TPA: efflux RND transporter periplasmic adaptor subunit [Acidobacteriaceae bacterium]|nr:efflux RND transporter periplasmic adaptor subunit [Acidobacteriaceae bacterium]